MITFDQLMQGFGVVTAMDMCIYTVKDYRDRHSCCSVGAPVGPLTPEDFKCTGDFIDTMKITNINQEGPTKTINGGRFAAPIIRYGKTTTLEANDALGKASTLTRFFGVEYNGETPIVYRGGEEYESEIVKLTGATNKVTAFKNAANASMVSKIEAVELIGTAETVNAESGIAYDDATKGLTFTASGQLAPDDIIIVKITMKETVQVGTPGTRLSVTEKFPGPFAIEGKTAFIDRNGEKKEVYIFIPQFYPNGVLNLTQDSEGDAAVFDLSGTLIPTEVREGGVTRTIVYEIRDTSFCKQMA